jgi:hypothetical protein
LYIFSRKDSDDVLDKLKNVHRLKLDDTFIDDPIDSRNDFEKGSLLIFDDCDTLKEKIAKAVYELMNDVLQTGRDLNLYVLVVSHLGSDYKKTRIVLSESSGIVLFPQGSSAEQIQYVLKNKVGVDKKAIQKIMALPSRWVYIQKIYPQAVIYDSGVYLLH